MESLWLFGDWSPQKPNKVRMHPIQRTRKLSVRLFRELQHLLSWWRSQPVSTFTATWRTNKPRLELQHLSHSPPSCKVSLLFLPITMEVSPTTHSSKSLWILKFLNLKKPLRKFQSKPSQLISEAKFTREPSLTKLKNNWLKSHTKKTPFSRIWLVFSNRPLTNP